MSKIIAVDFGLKRTGIAITDDLNIIASPLTTVDSTKLMSFLIELIKKEKVATIVLGEPKTLQNQNAHITENVYLLKEALEKQFPLCKVVLVDERFTSKMAFQSMIDHGLKKKQRQDKGMIDQISATIILQSYLQQIV
jgi:putative Holliday junction resolvase